MQHAYMRAHTQAHKELLSSRVENDGLIRGRQPLDTLELLN